MLKVYGIKNCDTMKKAFAWLEANGVAYEFIDYKKAGVVPQHLPDWNARAGWQQLLNTRGMMWKRLSDDEPHGAVVEDADARVLSEEDEPRQQRDGIHDLGGDRHEQQESEEPPHPLAGVTGHRDAVFHIV